MMNIETTEQLRELYGYPKGRAKHKQLPELEKHSIKFINHSPFVVISTFNQQNNVDISPRGGKPGFVHVLSNRELVLPDAKGNKRIDSLINIVETGRIGSIFFIPGIDETLRVNGRAVITVEESILNIYSEERNPPKTCIKIIVEEVFLHCAKALMRSKLWSPESKLERSTFPTMGQMMNDQLGINGALESQEEMIARYQKEL